MADTKISALNELAAEPAADDELAIVDTDAGETKRIVPANLFAGIDYTLVSGNDAATGVTGAELETLSDGSDADGLHAHATLVGSHAILDGDVHSDSVADGVTRGSLIYGNSTPNWDELVIGNAGDVLTSDAADCAWAPPAAPTHASTTGKTTDDHHNESHNIASHSDTTATGTELNTLVGAGDADALHTHNKLKINNKAITIEDPDNSEDLTMFFTDDAITVNQLAAVLTGDTTPSCTYTIRHHTDRNNAGNEILIGGTVVTSTTTGDIESAGWDDESIAANSWVWLETTAESGNVETLNVTIRYTFD